METIYFTPALLLHNSALLWELSGQPDIRILATGDWDTHDIPSPNKNLALSHSPICVYRKKALLLEAQNVRASEIPLGSWTAETVKTAKPQVNHLLRTSKNYLIPYLVDSYTRLAASPDCWASASPTFFLNDCFLSRRKNAMMP